MATSSIKSPVAWKLAGSVTGQTEIPMPTEYNEILLYGKANTYYWTVVVPKSEISASAIFPRASSFYNTSANAGITWRVTNSMAKLELCTENSGNIVHSNDAIVKLYYR